MVIEIARRLIAASGLLQEVSVVSAPSAAGRLGTERERPTTGVSELSPNLAYIAGFIDYLATWQVQRLELARDGLMGAGRRCVA